MKIDNWNKKGLLITPQKNLMWMNSHAMLPTLHHINGNIYRVYFSGRDKQNRSLIGYAEVEIIKDNLKVLKYSNTAVLSIGERGCFDDNGVTPSSIIPYKDFLYMFYIGWNSGTSTTRMSLVAGLAISSDGGETFERNSRAPLLERSDLEPYSILTAPYVLYSNTKKIWEMWYVSCEGWRNKDLPTYNIKYAYSNDCVNWTRDAKICIDFIDNNETALARPYVLFEENKYKMWFSYKSENTTYKIGYAESSNGINWNRITNNNELNVGKTGEWDSDMVEYSCVFNHGKYKFMLYNGNGYGENGIGYAVKNNEL